MSLDQSELDGTAGWRMQSWMPMVVLSILSAVFACGGFYAVSLSKWNAFDKSDKVLEARILRVEEDMQDIKTVRLDEAKRLASALHGLKTSFGISLTRAMKPVIEKQEASARILAVQVNAFARFEAEMRRALERIRDRGPTP